MPRTPSRTILATLGVAALLLTAGCLSGVSGSDVSTATDEPTEATEESAESTAEPTATATDASAESTAGTPAATDEPTATPASDTPSADEVAASFESRMDSLESFTATRVQTTDLGDETVSSTTDVGVRLSTGEYRTETVAPEERAGSTTIAGTETVWIVNDGNVSKFDRQGTGTSSTPTMVGQLTEGFEAAAVESTTVDGAETYRLTLEPEEPMATETTVIAHLDRETYFPVAIEQTTALDDSTMTTEIRYENVTLNASIPDERFVYEPDEDETVEEIDLPETETYESLAEMREATDATVPDPDVPDGYEFERGTVTSGNTTSVSLQYANGTASLSVSKLDAIGDLGDGENVTVGEREGRVDSFGDVATVSWTCDDWSYSVTGDLDRESLLATAESIECQ